MEVRGAALVLAFLAACAAVAAAAVFDTVSVTVSAGAGSVTFRPQQTPASIFKVCSIAPVSTATYTVEVLDGNGYGLVGSPGVVTGNATIDANAPVSTTAVVAISSASSNGTYSVRLYYK